nr:hypothetical protein [Caballeronia arvi]
MLTVAMSSLWGFNRRSEDTFQLDRKPLTQISSGRAKAFHQASGARRTDGGELLRELQGSGSRIFVSRCVSRCGEKAGCVHCEEPKLTDALRETRLLQSEQKQASEPKFLVRGAYGERAYECRFPKALNAHAADDLFGIVDGDKKSLHQIRLQI